MNISKLSILIASALISGSLLAQTVATVNGNKIDSSDIDYRVQVLKQQSNGQLTDSPELRQQLLQDLVVQNLILSDAKRLGLDKSKEYKELEAKNLAEAKKQGADKQASFKQTWSLFQNDLLEEIYMADFFKKNPIKEADIQKIYNENKQRYENTPEVLFRIIRTQSQEQAQAAIRELDSKKKIDDVVRKYTIDEEAKANGGVLRDYVSLVDIEKDNPSLYQTLANLKKGEYTKTPIVVADNAFQIIYYVEDKRTIKMDSYEQMKPLIEQGLAENKINQKIDELGRQAKIELAK